MASDTATVDRPDPRRPESWCREGVAHDHQACGSLWDSTSERDIAAAAAYADDLGNQERANIPTVNEILELVRLYAVARLMRNLSTPTRSTKGLPYFEQKHAGDVAECDRLMREIRDGLVRAGVPYSRPEPVLPVDPADVR